MENEHGIGFMGAKKATKYFGVCARTLRNWALQGKIRCISDGPGRQRFYDPTSYTGAAGSMLAGSNRSQAQAERKAYIYARVSSAKQRANGDLERQIQCMQEQFPEHGVIQDVGSGINFKRRGLNKLLRLVLQGRVSQVVVAHKDRLSRIAFDLIHNVLRECKVELLVQGDSLGRAPEEELGEDLMSIVHVFSCRSYGKRKYKRRKQEQEAKNNKEEGEERPTKRRTRGTEETKKA